MEVSVQIYKVDSCSVGIVENIPVRKFTLKYLDVKGCNVWYHPPLVLKKIHMYIECALK